MIPETGEGHTETSTSPLAPGPLDHTQVLCGLDFQRTVVGNNNGLGFEILCWFAVLMVCLIHFQKVRNLSARNVVGQAHESGLMNPTLMMTAACGEGSLPRVACSWVKWNR
jgi:hypothetical protein